MTIKKGIAVLFALKAKACWRAASALPTITPASPSS